VFAGNNNIKRRGEVGQLNLLFTNFWQNQPCEYSNHYILKIMLEVTSSRFMQTDEEEVVIYYFMKD